MGLYTLPVESIWHKSVMTIEIPEHAWENNVQHEPVQADHKYVRDDLF